MFDHDLAAAGRGRALQLKVAAGGHLVQSAGAALAMGVVAVLATVLAMLGTRLLVGLVLKGHTLVLYLV